MSKSLSIYVKIIQSCDCDRQNDASNFKDKTELHQVGVKSPIQIMIKVDPIMASQRPGSILDQAKFFPQKSG